MSEHLQEAYDLKGDQVLGVQGMTRVPRGRRISEARKRGINAAVMMLADINNGVTPSWYLQEALAPSSLDAAKAIDGNYPGIFVFRESMTTSDFPKLTGGIFDRILLDNYQNFPSPWRSLVKIRRPLADFRTVENLALNGGEGRYDVTPEGDGVKYGSLDEADYSYKPKKYTKGQRLSWEQIVNDDLEAFMSIPERLGRGGGRTVSRFVTELYIDASGPHASLYTAGNKNIITGNPVLGIGGLATGMEVMWGHVDGDDEPIFIESMVLVVGPALWVTANNIMNMLTVDLNEKGGKSNQRIRVNNWIIGNLKLELDPYIPQVASTANGATTWALFADPNMGRPALEVGFLRGFQEPVLYQRVGEAARVGGGLDQDAGSWATMTQDYKGMIVFGGTRVDPKMTAGSNGSGS